MQIKLVFVKPSTAIGTQEHISIGMSQEPEKLTMTAPRSMRIKYLILIPPPLRILHDSYQYNTPSDMPDICPRR